MVEINKLKLLPPRLGSDIIERSRLRELAGSVEGQTLITLTAPAGYGKTVTMMQMVQVLQKPVVWYHLDDYDNDPAVFIQYLTAGTQHFFPRFGKKVLPLLQQGKIVPQLRIILAAFINGLMSGNDEGLLFAFDDFHTISNPVVYRFLNELLDHLPSNHQMIIAGRTAPPLSLARLLIDGKVTSLEVEQLRFNQSEIADYLKGSNASFSKEFIQQIEIKTSGWPAVLRFMRGSTGEKTLQTLPSEEIYHYLATEIFERQPEKIRSFLLNTSVLELLTPQACDALLHISDSQQILESLEQQQLFLQPLEDREQCYQYHQLFRDFLLNRLGPSRNRLLGEAAKLAEQRGEWDALEYYIKAGLMEDAEHLLIATAEDAFLQGRWQTIDRWLQLLSGEQISANEWLALFQARIEVYRGRLDEAEKWIRQAMSGFASRPSQVGMAECQLLQARILLGRGSYPESLELLEKASLYLYHPEKRLRFDIPLEKSLNLWMIGRLHDAEVILKQAIHDAKFENNGFVMAHLLEGLGNIYYLQGEYPKALQVYHRGTEFSPERILPSYFTQDYVAAIYQEWGELDRALEYAKRNVAIKESYGATEALPSAYHQMGLIYLDRGEYGKAKEYFNRSIDLIQTNHGELFYLTMNKIFWARCLYMEGHWVEALAKAKEALAEAQWQSGLILAICQELYASIILLMGRFREAERILREVQPTFETMGFKRGACFCYSTLGLCSYYRRNRTEAGLFFKKSLELGAKANFFQSYVSPFDFARPILRYGLEHGIEVNFIQRVMVRRGSKAVSFLQKVASHANPEVRCRVIPPLADIGGEKAYSVIRRLTKDKDKFVREMALTTARRLNILPKRISLSQSAAIQIKTLGTFSVFSDGMEQRSINWPTVKTRDLLAYLVHQSQPVAIDRILEDLWPDLLYEKAAANFHTTLYRLRQSLTQIDERELIIYHNKHYCLESNIFLCDHRIFEELVGNGLQGNLTPPKVADLKKALELFGGDYLSELDYTWVLPAQEYFKQLYQDVNARLARYYFAEKDYAREIDYLHKLIELNPFSEEYYRLLISAFAGLGDRVSIRKYYRILTKLLDEELGIAPDPETQELYLKTYGPDRD